jgi:hypothetical protein
MSITGGLGVGSRGEVGPLPLAVLPRMAGGGFRIDSSGSVANSMRIRK